MENEFNKEIIKFNNIISLQQEQKRDTLNKINYLFNKENNLEENNSYSKANKYLMEQLNDLISDKEINIKLINQLKGDIIKLKTEINLYKAFNSKNKLIQKNRGDSKLFNKNENINNNANIGKNKLVSPEYQMKNYIDYNIDKYSIGFDYNKYKNNYQNINNFENESKNINELYKEANNNYNYPNNKKENYEINNNENELSNDYQRLNLLVQNSQDNLKYQEIIKQKELIVNGMK